MMSYRQSKKRSGDHLDNGITAQNLMEASNGPEIVILDDAPGLLKTI